MLSIAYYGDITGEIAFPAYCYKSGQVPDNSAKEQNCRRLSLFLPNHNISYLKSTVLYSIAIKCFDVIQITEILFELSVFQPKVLSNTVLEY
jgi:hypothetical protein